MNFIQSALEDLPVAVIEILRKRTVVMTNIKRGYYNFKFGCSLGPNVIWKTLKVAFPSI